MPTSVDLLFTPFDYAEEVFRVELPFPTPSFSAASWRPKGLLFGSHISRAWSIDSSGGTLLQAEWVFSRSSPAFRTFWETHGNSWEATLMEQMSSQLRVLLGMPHAPVTIWSWDRLDQHPGPRIIFGAEKGGDK